MVLARLAFAIAITSLVASGALAACNQSLFDNHAGPGGGRSDGGGGGGGGGGDDDAPPNDEVPSTCPATCLGDAAADFDGTARGSNSRWRYLEDKTAIAWTAMTGGTGGFTGQDAANQVTSCRDHPTEACNTLPGALLISSAAASDVDPAIEFTVPGTQVVQVSLRAYLATGGGQTIKIYRNSRYDLLLSAPVTAGNLTERKIILDALVGDRLLVAVSGSGAASSVAVQLFVHATDQTFPASCQLALPFINVIPSKSNDPCSGSPATYYSYAPMTGGTPAAMQFVPGPFAEIEPGLNVTPNHYLGRDGTQAIDWTGDTTLQFWLRLRTLTGIPAVAYADLDFDQCAGLQLALYKFSNTSQLQITSCTDPVTVTFDTRNGVYPDDTDWHFIRIVRTRDRFDACVDTGFVTSLSAVPDDHTTINPPLIGKEVSGPQDVLLDGQIDDVRIFRAALPCH